MVETETALAQPEGMGKDAIILFMFGSFFFFAWALTPYLYCDIWVACGWFALVGWIVYRHPNFFIRYLLLFFWLGGNLTGVFICENTSVWLGELDVRAHRADSLGLLSFAWFLWLGTMFFLDRRFPFHWEDDVGRHAWRITWRGKKISILSCVPYLMLIVLIVLFFHIWDHPYFVENIDRFAFRKRYLDGLWFNLVNLCQFLVPLLLVQWFRMKKRWLLILLAAYGIVLFWTGEKFGRYWECFVYGCLLYSVFNQHISVRKIRKKALTAIGGVLLLFGVTLGHYIFWHPNGDSMSFFYQRAAQQGQLWWRTYESDKEGNYRWAELSDEVNVFFQLDDTNEKKYRHGIYKIMRYVTPSDIFEKKVVTGSTFSTSNHATYFYYFKEWGVIILSVLSGMVMWGGIRIWLICTASGFVVETIFATRLMKLLGALLMASGLSELFSYKGMAYVFLLTVLLWLRYRCRSNKGTEVCATDSIF